MRTDRRLFFIFSTVFCYVIIFITPVKGSDRVDTVVNRLQEWYDSIEDFQTEFHQKSFSQILNSSTEAKGKLFFKKPNLIKWSYESPEKQEYIIEKEYFWWYLPEDAQVVKKKAGEVLKDTTPLSFLAGLGNLQKSFIITLAEDGKEGAQKESIYLDLNPRDEQKAYKSMQLKVNSKSFEIMGITLIDSYGNRNEIDFFNMQSNQGLKSELFQFVPPKGVDIINGDFETTGKPF